MHQKTGILLINLGTPDAPTEEAVYRFLSEFLNDPYVVDYPAWLWKPILNRIILRTRPQKSARNYVRIWQDAGSPLLSITQSIAKKLEKTVPEWEVAIGMRYGNPSIQDSLRKLLDRGTSHLVILPLYPQLSSTTSLTSIDHIKKVLEKMPGFDRVSIIEEYHSHPAYISALADSLQQTWKNIGKPEMTLFSFHGVPQRYITKKGEPYHEQCIKTFQLVCQEVGLDQEEITLGFQSRFGPEPWLHPYTDQVLAALGGAGCENLHVICPGFAADCLETLEEIAIQGKINFQQAGGKDFHYIPALNDDSNHIQALEQIIQDELENKKG
jgi:ferrochelatase